MKKDVEVVRKSVLKNAMTTFILVHGHIERYQF